MRGGGVIKGYYYKIILECKLKKAINTFHKKLS